MKWHIIILYFILACLVTITILFKLNEKKIAYVNTAELYDKFQMSKELTEKIKKVEDSRKIILDSLMMRLQLKQKEIQNEKMKDEKIISEFESAKQEYLMKQKQFENDNSKIKQEYFDQIWTQLNQYVQDFGKKNNCEYILGATGQGNLMFASEKTNITSELIEYVNQRYNDTAKK